MNTHTLASVGPVGSVGSVSPSLPNARPTAAIPEPDTAGVEVSRHVNARAVEILRVIDVAGADVLVRVLVRLGLARVGAE
jgi:hypothetical protein